MIAAPPVRILLVEDSPGDIRLTREALSEAQIGNELHVARDGEQALAFLRRDAGHAGAPRPDLVLLDLNLPRMDGGEVLAALRADPELAAIPVIMLTTSSSASDRDRAYALGADSYVTKPLGLGDFIDVVREIERFWLSADGDAP